MKEEKKEKIKAKNVPAEYKNIDPKICNQVCEILEKAIKFEMPKGGIHKPMVWHNKKNQWGILYRVYAMVNNQKISSIKATKYLALQLKWTSKRGFIIPNKGYEGLISPIDTEYNLLFEKLRS